MTSASAREVVGEHALEFGLASFIDDDLDAPGRVRGAQRGEARVAEHQPVQPDVGVEDEARHAAY